MSVKKTSEKPSSHSKPHSKFNIYLLIIGIIILVIGIVLILNHANNVIIVAFLVIGALFCLASHPFSRAMIVDWIDEA